MGFKDRIGKLLGTAQGSLRADGLAEVAIGDAAYDDWDIVADYGELETARAFRQALDEAGFQTMLTSDWPLDEYGRGDISLRVPAGRGIDAGEALEPE